VAAPIFSRVTQASLRLMNIPPTEFHESAIVGVSP